jgi:hypothetical protein
MSKTIVMPDELFARLERAAAGVGATPLGWIDSMLPMDTNGRPSPADGLPSTMAERLAGRLGRIGSGTGLPAADQASDSFAEYLLAKQRAGHL